MIDRVSILAPSRAGSLPQGFMVIADVVYDAETCGSGAVRFRAIFVWLLRRLRTFTGPSRHCHVIELLTDGIDA